MTQTKSRNAGNGGETHQVSDADHSVLTTNHGTPVSPVGDRAMRLAGAVTLSRDGPIR